MTVFIGHVDLRGCEAGSEAARHAGGAGLQTHAAAHHQAGNTLPGNAQCNTFQTLY